MKVKYVLDKYGGSRKDSAIKDVMRKLGSKVTVSGDVIEVESYNERDVADILNRAGVKYSRG